MTAFRRLAALAAALICAQIVLGAVVRLTGSGLACPDWPLCYGLWLPTPAALAAVPGVEYDYWQVLAEWAHRFNAAALVAPAAAAFAFAAWRVRAAAPALPRIVFAALALLLAQAGLGGFTVLDRNSPWSVAAHLVAALALLALVLHALSLSRAAPPPRLGRVEIAAALAVAAAAASGAMTAKAGATLACPGWPLCGAALDDPLARLHFAHRVFAAAVVVAVAAAWLRARRRGAFARRLAAAALAALAAQIALGAWMPDLFAGAGLWPQVAGGAAHQAVAVALFACLVALAPMPPGAAAREADGA